MDAGQMHTVKRPGFWHCNPGSVAVVVEGKQGVNVLLPDGVVTVPTALMTDVLRLAVDQVNDIKVQPTKCTTEQMRTWIELRVQAGDVKWLGDVFAVAFTHMRYAAMKFDTAPRLVDCEYCFLLLP